MKSHLPLLFCISASLIANYSFARVGELRQDIEERLHSKLGGAYQYVSKEDRIREAMELPYKNLIMIMPRNIWHSFYYKRPDSTTSSNSDTVQQYDIYGWEVHYIYRDDKSVWEFYRRQGDPMTMEELVELMTLMANSRNAKWVETSDVNVVNSWKYNYKDSALQRVKKLDGKISERDALMEMLPHLDNRFIYVEIPEEVRLANNYGQTITNYLEEDAQRIAYDEYRKYIANQSATSAAKTARSNAKNAKQAPKRVNPFDGSTTRQMESLIFAPQEKDAQVNFVRYQMPNVFFGGVVPKNRTKDVVLTMPIPIQKETCIGFDYELSDGSMRAKLYKNGVLFCDTQFDKFMRTEMERLYKKQSEKRRRDAADSVSKF